MLDPTGIHFEKEFLVIVHPDESNTRQIGIEDLVDSAGKSVGTRFAEDVRDVTAGRRFNPTTALPDLMKDKEKKKRK